MKDEAPQQRRGSATPRVPAASLEAIWHDVECGAYSADLPFWVELASTAPGPVLELGAGTGRIALQLADAGLEVVALDSSATLLAELAARAEARRVEVQTVCADARRLELDRDFGAVLAPMQFVHLLGGSRQRVELLRVIGGHLRAGAIVAAALLAEDATAVAVEPGVTLLPDVRELDGWVYSSLPIEVAVVPGGAEIRRMRQVVSPAGELSEEAYSIHLDARTAEQFEAEAETAGLRPRERLEIPATDDHVGSTICILESA
jgi:SAM-dependent methyltransferase